MSIFEVILLGLVEGLTEYLPVSSTGHLLVVQALLDLARGTPSNPEAANAFAIVIQAGAILAVLGLYRERVRRAFVGVLGRDAVGRDFARDLLVAFAPAVVIGGLFNNTIERVLFGLWPVAIAWILGGAVILGTRDWINRREGIELEQLGWRRALVVGLIQCLAMWPGTSRSFATIVGGRLVGLTLAASVEFSFLLGVLTLGAATALKLFKNGALLLDTYGALNLVVGLLVAWVSAVVSVKWMVRWLQTRSLAIFGYWRIAAGLVVIALLLAGR